MIEGIQMTEEKDTEGGPAIDPRTRAACDIATGRAAADPNSTGFAVVGAKKDLNAKGRGPEWYRMVYRDGGWRYVSDERLPAGNFRASDRRAAVKGVVFAGEICVDHDRGKPVSDAYLITFPDEDGNPLEDITFKARRDGNLAFALPDGSEVVLPNPRAK